MAYSLNDKIKNLAPYYPIEGNYSVRLDANESFLHLSDDMLEKFKHEIDRLAFNRYPDPVASRAVKAFASYNNINPKLVTAGNGSDELISIIINAFLMKGEVVLTTSPDFSMYAFYSQLAENTIEVYEKDENFEIDIDKLILKAAETKARMIIFSNPCNPTTLGIKKSDVKKLIALTDALVVIDEAYMDFWDQSVLDCVEQYDNLIVLKTCSKAISAAAIRLGFAVACKTLTTAIRAVKSPYNMNALTNIAGEIIYSDPRYLNFAISQIKESAHQLYNSLAELSDKMDFRIYDTKTNFVLIKIDGASHIHRNLLRAGISVRLLADCLRISAGTSRENAEFLNAFEKLF